jgi:hypothetical protein
MSVPKTKHRTKSTEANDGARKFFSTLLMLFGAFGLFILVVFFIFWIAFKNFSIYP